MRGSIAIFLGMYLLTACSGNAGQIAQPQTAAVETSQGTEAASETAAQETQAQAAAENTDALEDISLSVDKKEITADKNENEVIFYAEIPAKCSPEKFALIDAKTGETAAELFDEADFEKYGDTIKGDSVYNCRFKVNDSINTNSDVSETAVYSYYAVFTDDKGTHRSNTVDITVYEQFTDKELADMEAVDNAVSALTDSESYKALSVEQRKEKVTQLLNELADKGTADRNYSLIKKDSIAFSDTMVSFEYNCGVSGGVMLKEFDPYMN